MNQRIKKLWIKALLSGKFKQGSGKLRKHVDGEVFHCCLGVLEEIRVAQTGSKFSTGLERDGNQSLLSKATYKWAGLDSNDPVIMPKYRMTASELNDDGKSFRFIAGRIEKYL